MTAKQTDLQDTFDKGRHDFMNGKFESSIAHLSEVLRLDPKHKLAIITRGTAFLKLEQLDDAHQDFDRAIGIDPEYARAFHLRGMVKDQKGENESALDDFSRAIDLEPEYGAAYYSRATLLTKMKEEDRALEDIEMVQHLTNKNIETFANDNNVWRSQQLRLESMIESDLAR